jgi:hypothetical protein
VAATSKKRGEATFKGADGVVRFGEILGPEDFAELTTPSAPLLWLRDFLLLGAATLLFKEGKTTRHSFER